MSYEHPLGFSCEDVDDRLRDVEQALASSYMSLARIRDWLGKALDSEELELDQGDIQYHQRIQAMAEGARAEAIEQVGRA